MDTDQALVWDLFLDGLRIKAPRDKVLPRLKIILPANSHTILILMISEYHKISQYHKINKTKK
jgi:hypothetical protein